MYFLNISFNYLVSTHYKQLLLAAIIPSFLLFISRFDFFEKIKYYYICIAAFLIYIIWSKWVNTIPISDFNTFYEQTKYFSKTGSLLKLQESKSTGTILYYSLWFKILGSNYLSIYFGSAFAWASSGAILYKATQELNIPKKSSTLFLLIFLFSPSTILYSSVMSSESIFTLIFSICLLFTIRFYNSHNISYLIILSLSCGALFLTRTIGVVLIISIILLIPTLSLSKIELKHKIIKITSAALIPFVVTLMLQGLLNYKIENNFSVTPSKWGAFLLLTGTYEPSNGRYSKEQAELVGFIGENKIPHDEASKLAVEIALERIISSPIRFLEFSLTDKVEWLWSSKWAMIWSTNTTTNEENIKPFRILLHLVTNSYLIFAILTFTAWVLINIKNKWIFILMLPVTGLAILHIFVEVQGRYQIPMMPFIYLGAGIAINELGNKINNKIR